MKKSIFIGAATLAIAGTALIGSSIYAATGSSTGNTNKSFMKMGNRGTDMISSLSGTVSSEALTALKALMDKHKTEMDALKESTTTVDEATMTAKHEAFKTEMDALMVKYPELKNALPQGKMNGRGGERGQNPMEEILSSLPTDAQTEIETIRESYRTQMESLRTAEESKIEAIIGKYPEVKTKYDEAKKNRPTMEQGKMNGRGGKRGTNTNTTVSSES